MGRVRIQVSADGMAAEAHVASGAAMARDEFLALLAAAGVVQGLDAERIAELATRLSDEGHAGRVIVACGVRPTPGQDGRLEVTHPSHQNAGLIAADGHIDFRERSLLCSARAGEVVARIVPPLPGKPGTDVRGRAVVPPPSKAAAPRLGPGVKLSPDGQIVAAVDGVIQCVAGQAIDVLPQWKHDGSVDLHSGNLHVTGTLVVRGDVCQGCTAAATGDVLVQGTVLDGSVHAGGSVVVVQSIQGHCDVRAGSDIACRHATAAILCAGGTVRIHDSAAHCHIRGNAVEALGGRGHVVGGELRARHSIALLEVGTAGGAPTLLVVGDHADATRDLARADAAAQRAARATSRVVLAGNNSERGRVAKLGRSQCTADDEVLAQRLELSQRQQELRAARISIRGKVHPGVCVQFGPHKLEVREPTEATTFRWDEPSNTIVGERP